MATENKIVEIPAQLTVRELGDKLQVFQWHGDTFDVPDGAERLHSGVRVLNQSLIRSLEIPPQVIAAITQQEQQELERRERAYRGNRPKPNLLNRTVLLVDDGLATGASMRAAVVALREQHPARIIVAVPTAATEACAEFAKIVDEMICAETPDPFWGVGMWYYDFSPTSDEEVRSLLKEAQGAIAVGP